MSEEMKNESDRGEEEEGNEMDEIGTCLTPAAVAGLYEFHQEQRRIREAGDDGEERRATLLENDLAKFFPEDWQISQFWYDDPTTTVFSQEILRLMEEDEESRVAFLSCPSVFRHCFNPTTPHKGKIHNPLLSDYMVNSHDANVFFVPYVFVPVDLFEFDRRFSAYGSCFHFYDYNSPDVIPVESVGLYSILMLDPPFLSLDCLTKMGKTVQLLAKPGAKVILCTGKFHADTRSDLSILS